MSKNLPARSENEAVLSEIRRMVQALRKSSRRAEQQVGLSGAQLFVLRRLSDSDSALSLSELAARTSTDLSSVSIVVSRLAERGLVNKGTCSHDARRSEITLSSKGRTFLNRHSPVTAQERLADAVARISPRRRRVLAELLTEVNRIAGFHGEKPTMFFEDERKRQHPK